MATTRAYRGVSADDRRTQRRQALVDTALDCLEADGLSGVSVRSICARARLTPRYFYESFADLDELLLATVAAVTDELGETSLAALAAAPNDPAAQVRAALDAGYGLIATDRRKANALLVVASGHGALRARRQAVVTEFADLIMDGLPALNAVAPADRQRTRATALFLMGGTADVIEAVLAGRLRMARARVVDHLAAMWLGALGSDRGSGVGATGAAEPPPDRTG